MSTANTSTTITTVPFLGDAHPSPVPELLKAGDDWTPSVGMRSRSRDELDLEKVESAGDKGDEEEGEEEGDERDKDEDTGDEKKEKGVDKDKEEEGDEEDDKVEDGDEVDEVKERDEVDEGDEE